MLALFLTNNFLRHRWSKLAFRRGRNGSTRLVELRHLRIAGKDGNDDNNNTSGKKERTFRFVREKEKREGMSTTTQETHAHDERGVILASFVQSFSRTSTGVDSNQRTSKSDISRLAFNTSNRAPFHTHVPAHSHDRLPFRHRDTTARANRVGRGIDTLRRPPCPTYCPNT